MAFLFVCVESFGLFVGALAYVADEVSFVRVCEFVSFELRDVVAFVFASSAFELVYAYRVFSSDVSFPAAHSDEGAWFASECAEDVFFSFDVDVFLLAWSS